MPNIIETTRQSGQFNTLIKAIEVAGLMDALGAPGPFTLFAPTDEAFDQVSQEQLQQVMNDPEQLRQILLYHIVNDELFADDVLEMEEIPTLQGDSIQVTTHQGIMLDDAQFAETDIECDNGVIHVIDSVIVPEVVAKQMQAQQW